MEKTATQKDVMPEIPFGYTSTFGDPDGAHHFNRAVMHNKCGRVFSADGSTPAIALQNAINCAQGHVCASSNT